MTKEEIKNKLRDGVCEFKYTKKDGSERLAKGTLKISYIVEELGKEEPKGSGVEKQGVISYFDIDKDGWRSFQEGSFIEFV